MLICYHFVSYRIDLLEQVTVFGLLSSLYTDGELNIKAKIKSE